MLQFGCLDVDLCPRVDFEALKLYYSFTVLTVHCVAIHLPSSASTSQASHVSCYIPVPCDLTSITHCRATHSHSSATFTMSMVTTLELFLLFYVFNGVVRFAHFNGESTFSLVGVGRKWWYWNVRNGLSFLCYILFVFCTQFSEVFLIGLYEWINV